MNIAALIRDPAGRPLDLPVRLRLRRPNGQVAAEYVPPRQDGGAMYWPMRLSAGATFGVWSLEALTDPDAPPVGRTTFRVEAFLPERLAIAAGPALAAGVAYYGPAGDPAQAGRVKARLLLHYAGNDERVNAGAPAWIDALKAAGVQVTRHDYPGTEHAFHNDTSAERYNEAAARLSWDRTISFFAAALGGPRGPVGAAR